MRSRHQPQRSFIFALNSLGEVEILEINPILWCCTCLDGCLLCMVMRLEKLPNHCLLLLPISGTCGRRNMHRSKPRQVSVPRQGFTHVIPRPVRCIPPTMEKPHSCPHLTRYGGGELFHISWADQLTLTFSNVTPSSE